MTLFFYGLWMLCGLSCAVFATDAAGRRTNRLCLAAGFTAAALVVRPDRLPDVAWIAGAMLVLAALRVIRPTPRVAACAAAGAGIVAAVWAALFQTEGVPLVAALPLAAAVPALSAWLASHSPAFAPAEMHDEALLIVAALSAALAVAPGLVSGWQSATVLNLDAKRDVAQALPEWTVLTTLAAASLGGAYSLWTRR